MQKTVIMGVLVGFLVCVAIGLWPEPEPPAKRPPEEQVLGMVEHGDRTGLAALLATNPHLARKEYYWASDPSRVTLEVSLFHVAALTGKLDIAKDLVDACISSLWMAREFDYVYRANQANTVTDWRNLQQLLDYFLASKRTALLRDPETQRFLWELQRDGSRLAGDLSVRGVELDKAAKDKEDASHAAYNAKEAKEEAYRQENGLSDAAQRRLNGVLEARALVDLEAQHTNAGNRGREATDVRRKLLEAYERDGLGNSPQAIELRDKIKKAE